MKLRYSRDGRDKIKEYANKQRKILGEKKRRHTRGPVIAKASITGSYKLEGSLT